MVPKKITKSILFVALLFLAQGLLSTTAMAVKHFDFEFDAAAIRSHKVVGDKKWKQKSPKDGSKDPEFIQDVRAYFKKAIITYDTYRFLLPPLPVKVKIVISNSGNPGWTKKGIVYIRTPDSTDHSKLRHTIAHELFHAIQHNLFIPALESKVGGGVFEALFAGPLLWWIEATAEYAAGELVWPRKARGRSRMGHLNIEPKLLNYGLEFTGKKGIYSEDVEYDRGYFIKYLVDAKNKIKSAADIALMHNKIQIALVDKGRWKRENGLKPLDTYLRSTTKKSLWEWHRDFAGYFLFSNQRPNYNTHSPDDSVTTRHTFKIVTKEKASPLKISAGIGGQGSFPPYSAEAIAIDFDFPDDDARSVKISVIKPLKRIMVDLYVLRKVTEPISDTENYVMIPAPVRRGTVYRKAKTVRVTRQDVLFLVLSSDEYADSGRIKIEYFPCSEGEEKFCPPGAWGKGGCYPFENGMGGSCHKGLRCPPLTGPCITPGQEPFCTMQPSCKSKKNEMNTETEKEGNGAQGSSSSPCLPGQSCFRW